MDVFHVYVYYFYAAVYYIQPLLDHFGYIHFKLFSVGSNYLVEIFFGKNIRYDP